MSAVSEENCVKHCAQATEEVLMQVLDGEVKRGDVSMVHSPVEILEVAVILGLTGDYEGRILFEFSHASALKIAVAMNFGEPFEELDHMARATLSELGNLVAGRFVSLHNDAGGELHISPPILMCGIGMRSSDQSAVHRIAVETNCGQVFVNLSVRPRMARSLGVARSNGSVAVR
jgi:chemotaxis protein CheX